MTYEYVCTACAHEWEAEQSMSEPALTTCPSCKAESAKRQISGGTGFILRGGGWYADGYGSKKPSTAESPKPATTPTTTTPTTTQSESAPAKPASPAKTSTDS